MLSERGLVHVRAGKGGHERFAMLSPRLLITLREYSYNSCRNRHCPKCQSLAQEKWVAERLARSLPVSHFHVVFTLPAALRQPAAYWPALVYDLLFETASATLIDVGRGPKLGGLLGITAVLHTWTRELELHPHLHCIVTGGALASAGFRYLGRYTHRVGIANSRLLDVSDDHVTFRTKDGKAITLAPVDFLARFVQHVLPRGYVKIRHYGLLAGSNVHTLLERARSLLRPAVPTSNAPIATSWLELLLALTGRDVRRCPRCDGAIVVTALPSPPSPTARAPPC